MNSVEEKRNKLNFEIRALLSLIDIIDGKQQDYINYNENNLDEEEYLNQQTNLVIEAKEKLLKIFKE